MTAFLENEARHESAYGAPVLRAWLCGCERKRVWGSGNLGFCFCGFCIVDLNVLADKGLGIAFRKEIALGGAKPSGFAPRASTTAREL